MSAPRNQTAYLTAPGKIELRDTAMPSPGPGELLVEVRHVGICGSDIMFYDDPGVGGKLDTPLPVVLGHESAGIVTALGEGVEGFAVGDAVALEPGVPCGHCQHCLDGSYHLCPDVDFMAAPPWNRFALSRYITHPAAFSFKLPAGVSTLQGALVEPLAVGLHAARRAGAHLGETAVILGSGCIGLCTLMACKAMGVSRVIVADLFENRLEAALSMGADVVVNSSEEDMVARILELTGGGAPLVFETAGSTVTAKACPALVAPGGRVVLVGNLHEDVTFDFFTCCCKEADILTIFRYHGLYPTAINAIGAGSILVEKIATNFFPFERVAEAFETARNQKQTALKVVVEF